VCATADEDVCPLSDFKEDESLADKRVKARPMVKREARGKALVCREAFSFLGDVDMNTGEIIARGHEHEGESIAGRVLIYPETKGSSGGCVVLMSLARIGRQPAAIVLEKMADPNIVEGAILAEVALVCEPEVDLIAAISNGADVTVDGTTGEVSWSD
jgi:predicted aconitase with swiveling domain